MAGPGREGEAAKRAGATVFATASSNEKLARLDALALHRGINYATHDVVAELMALTGGKGVDLVVNPVGGPTMHKGLLALGMRGRGSMVGHAGREAMTVDMSSLMAGNRSLTGMFFGAEVMSDRVPDMIQRHIDDAAKGVLDVVLDRTLQRCSARAGDPGVALSALAGRRRSSTDGKDLSQPAEAKEQQQEDHYCQRRLQREDPDRVAALLSVKTEEPVPGVSGYLHRGRDDDPADPTLSKPHQEHRNGREMQGEIHCTAVQRGEHKPELLGQAHSPAPSRRPYPHSKGMTMPSMNDVIVISATSTRPGTPTKKSASVTIGGRSGA